MTDVDRPSTVVFISHAGADSSWAEWAADRLRRAGYVVEMDRSDWLVGDDFVQRMASALDRADLMVAIWSAAYFNPDGFTIKEWAAAFAAHLRVVPVKIEAFTPPVMWRSTIYVDVCQVGDERAEELLLAAVAAQSLSTSVAFPDQSMPAVTWSRAWNVPSRSTTFVGRDDLIAQVHGALDSGREPCVVALHGMGGVGKTQLAIEVAHRYGTEYDQVWWVDAEQPSLIGEQMAAFAVAAGAATVGTETPAAVDALRAALRARCRWLVVFDNASGAEELARWIPQGAGHVLVTSRSHVWTGVALAQRIDLFRRDESVSFLLTQHASLSEVEAEKLAAALGDLPLALAQAAGVMAETGMPSQEYLTSLSGAASEVLAVGTPIGYPVSVAAAVRTSLERLGGEDPAARQLVELCSLLGPEPIPIWLIAEGAAFLAPPLSTVAANTFALRRTLGRVGRYGLVEVGREAVTMHRLVQTVVAEVLAAPERDALRRITERLVVAAAPDDGSVPTGWARWRQLMPHLLAVGPVESTIDELRNVACAAVWQLIARGDSLAAHPLAESLCERWRELSGPDDPYVLLAFNNLAVIYRDMGRFEQALKLDEDTLVRRTRVLGPDHVHTLHSSINLAIDLRQLGQLQRARTLDEETLERRRRVLGELHPNTIGSVESLALDLRGLGRVDEALRLDEAALAGYQQVLGVDHPYTLACANHLAADLRLLGRLSEACALNEATYGRYVAVLGEDHPDTLHCASDLAQNLRELGLYQKALDLDERTLDLYASHGRDRPDALRAANNLAADLRALGRIGQARALDEATYDACRRMLGDDHPDTLRAQGCLALDLRLLNLPRLAEDLEEDMLARYRRTLGDDHPYTLSALDEVAASRRPGQPDPGGSSHE